MDELVAFLRARLDEDEARSWSVHDVAKCDALLYEEDMADAARRDPDCDCGYPARVLREVEAKRAIVDECNAMDDEGLTPGLRSAVVSLAAVYGDHPDYRQEWRP